VPEYGYLHMGRVTGYNIETGGYMLDSVSLAHTSKWGPISSCVPGLRKGDRVVLGATGTSRDNLVIIAKLGADFPQIDDVAGLLDALQAKADATAIDQLSNWSTALEGRIGDLESGETAADGRLDSLESRATAVEGRATAVEGRATSLEGRATALETIEAARPYNQGDRDLYGTLIESITRHTATSTATLANGVANLQVSYANRAFNFASLRAVVTTAGTGAGSAVAAVYVGTSRATMILHVTQAILLNALGEQLALFSGGGQAFSGFPFMALGILGSGYTVSPQIAASPAPAHAHVLNPTGQLSSVTKAIGAWPGSIDLTDGTWAASSNRAWMGLVA